MLSNLPLFYAEALVSVLRDRIQPDEWKDPDPVEAARRDALLNLQILESARSLNGIKAWLIFIGILAESAAASAVAVAVYSVLSGLGAPSAD
jgi:hypothetical protein